MPTAIRVELGTGPSLQRRSLRCTWILSWLTQMLDRTSCPNQSRESGEHPRTAALYAQAHGHVCTHSGRRGWKHLGSDCFRFARKSPFSILVFLPVKQEGLETSASHRCSQVTVPHILGEEVVWKPVSIQPGLVDADRQTSTQLPLVRLRHASQSSAA